MNNFIFYSPTEFVFGRDTEAQTGVLVQKYGARKIMIVYGGGSVIRSGLLARVEKSLQEVGIPYCMLGGVQPNPIDTKVYEGIITSSPGWRLQSIAHISSASVPDVVNRHFLKPYFSSKKV